MAEYINKADMWEAYENSKNDVDMAEQFERLPTIDIVYCNNCKHLDTTICLTSFPAQYRCKLGNGSHRLDFFCADGERSDG